MPAGLIGNKNVKGQSSRTNGPNRPKPAPPILISDITKSGTTATIVFNQAVTCKGVPDYTTSISGVTAISAELTAPNTVVVTFSAAITTATTITIPFEDPAIRNTSGGFANAGTFPA